MARKNLEAESLVFESSDNADVSPISAVGHPSAGLSLDRGKKIANRREPLRESVKARSQRDKLAGIESIREVCLESLEIYRGNSRK